MMKRIYITIPLTLFFVAAFGQTIQIVRFNNTPSYAAGSGVSVHFKPNLFKTGNVFTLQLSDAAGNFTAPVNIGTVTEFFVPVINGVIPAGTPAGTNYRLRIIGSIGNIISTSTNPFRIITGTPLTIPAIEAVAPVTMPVKCLGNSNFFGYLNMQSGASSLVMSFDIKDYDPAVSWTINLINSAGTVRSVLPVIAGNVEIGSLPIGYYMVELIKTQNSIATVFSYIVLVERNGTGLTNLSSEQVCTGSPVQFRIDGINDNYPGSKYTISYGDGSAPETYTHDSLMANPLLSHIFTTPTCNSPSSIPDPNNNNNRAFAVDLQLFNKGLASNCTDYTTNSQKKSFVNASTPPNADFNVPQTVCNNTGITATNTSIGGYYGSGSVCLRSFVSSWQYKKPSSSNYVNAPSSWINSVTGNLSIPASAVNERGCWSLKLQVQNPEGCPTVSIKEKTVGVEVLPTPAFNVSATTICTNQSVAITDQSNANAAGCQQPVFSWNITPSTGFTITGPGTPNPTITFADGGVYTIVQTITNSCGTRSSAARTITVNGAPVVSFSPASANLCKPGPLNEIIDFSLSPYKPTYSTTPFAPTSWSWTVDGPATDYDFITANNVDYPKIRFKAFRCYNISVTVNGNCNPPNSKTLQLCFKQSPQITTTPLSATICSKGTAPGINLAADMVGASFSWQAIYAGVTPATPSSGTTNIPARAYEVTGSSPGSITYTMEASVNGCTGPSKQYVITVTPAATAEIKYEASPLCNTVASSPVKLTGTTGGAFTASPAGLVIDAVTGTISPAVSTTGTYTVTYSIAPSHPCAAFSTTATVVINQGNAASASISYPSALCNVTNTATTPNPPVTVVRIGTPGGTYSIVPAMGLLIDAASGSITPAGATPGSYTITYAIANTAGCSDYKVTTNVTIHPVPTAQISYAGQLCTSMTAAPVTLSGNTGGTYSSTAGLVINAATGTINPSLSTPGSYTVTYTVAPSAPCPGASASANITITQAPSANISYPVTLCNVANTPATPNLPVPVTHTGTTGGAYSITPATGLNINTTTGVLDPSGATPGTYTITYTIAASGGCNAFTTSATVNISGTPDATIQYSTPLCSSAGIATVTRTGNAGGTYTATPAGLSIDPSTGAINTLQSIPGTYDIIYTIAPSAPCPGFTTKTTVTITQAPSASISYPATLCNVANTPSTPNGAVTVTQTGSPGGVYSIVPATGLTIDAATGTIMPAGATPGTYTINYTIAAASGCPAYTAHASVTVSNTPTATIQYTTPLCSSAGIATVTRTGNTGGLYTATPAGLSIDPASGAINTLQSAPGTYDVIYTIAPSAPCPGFVTKTTVTITQAPSATISYPATLCNVPNTPLTPNNPVAVTQTGTSGGVYSILPATGLSIDANTGTIIPSNAAASTYAITYTIPAAGGCPAFTTLATVVVNSTPTATISYPGSPYCNGITQLQPVTTTGNTGGVYTSTSGLSINPVTGAINPSLSIPGTYTVSYTVTPVAPCFVFSTTASVTITEAPTISLANPAQTICSGETAIFRVIPSLANTNLTWSVTGALPPGIAGIASGNIQAPATDIHLSFTNTGITAQTISIQAIPVNPAQNPCAGPPVVMQLTVNPISPIPLISDTVKYCQAAPAAPLTAGTAPGHRLIWYDSNGQLLPAAPTPSTATPAQFIYYISQVNAYNCESPKKKVVVVINPTPAISYEAIKDPTDCGIPSGAIMLTVTNINSAAPIANAAFEIYYNKDHSNTVTGPVTGNTNAAGALSIALSAGTYTNVRLMLNGCTSNILAGPYSLKDPTPPGKPAAGYNTNLCSNDTLRLTALSVPGVLGNGTPNGTVPVTYVWAGPAFGNNNYTTSSSTVALAPPLEQKAGFYVVYAMQGNCRSVETTFTVTVDQAPSKPVIITRNPLCVGDDLPLQANSIMPGSDPRINYTWTGPGLNAPVNAQNTGINKVTVNDGGLYTITATSPATGCSAQTDTFISIGNYPDIVLGPGPVTLPTGAQFNLTPRMLNANTPNVLPMQSYAWTPSTDIKCYGNGCDSAVATVKRDVCYQVKATNIYGCSDTASICIKAFCQSAQVFIPNAFTPDGDGQNDIFMVRATGIASVRSFRIFNRYGEIVFEKYNFTPNTPAYGWNGTIKGQTGIPAVYVYIAEVVCENGTTYSYHGNVTLLR